MKERVITQVYFIEGDNVYDSMCFFKHKDALKYIEGLTTKKGLNFVDNYNEEIIWNFRYITVH